MHADQEDFVIRSLRAVRRQGWFVVAKGTKVSFHTIAKMADGTIKHPRYDKLKPLVKHFMLNPVPGVAPRLIR
jgi:hypothetical protein